MNYKIQMIGIFLILFISTSYAMQDVIDILLHQMHDELKYEKMVHKNYSIPKNLEENIPPGFLQKVPFRTEKAILKRQNFLGTLVCYSIACCVSWTQDDPDITETHRQ